MKIINIKLIIVFIEIAAGDISPITGMIRAPCVAHIEKSADADTQRLFQPTFAVGDGAIELADTAIETQPARAERLIFRRLNVLPPKRDDSS